MINNFWDANQNSFFDTSKYSNPLILRPNILQDNVVPSGSSVAFRILIKLFYITNDKRSEIKNEINKKFGSKIIEVKSYKKY